MLRWLRRHWFASIAGLIVVLWIATMVAYYLGVEGFTVRNRLSGAEATVDFMRKYDRPVVEVADGIGLELDPHAPTLTGAIVRLEDAPIPLCWICGRKELAGGLAIVEYRQGDWLFRAPKDDTQNSEAVHGQRRESRDYILTVAYNVATGERLIGTPDLASQAALLSAHGLVASDATHLEPATLAGFAPASMMREGCWVFNMAFALAAVLWLVFGGTAVLVIRLVRRRR